MALPNDSSMQRESVAQLHAARKLVPNMWPPGDGTQRHALPGTTQNNRLGLRAKRSRNKSNRCSRTFQPLRFVHDLVSHVGTLVKSDKVTDRIRDTGRHWQCS